ncbi:MAG: hypothetical protein ACK4YP_18560 [Myxococcota bacterium]
MLAFLLACAAPEEPEVLLTGWAYEWAELSHRVAYLRVGVDADERLALGLVGGDWSTGEAFVDTPSYRVRYQRVDADGLHVVRGTATLLVGPGPTASTTLTLDATGVPAGTAVALIDGFTIDTDVPQGPDYPSGYDPAHGYTSNGFGFALGDVTRAGDTLSVPVEATVRWGPQDRDDVNAAIPHAVTEVTVDVAVLVSESAREVEEMPVGGSVDHEWDPPRSEQVPMEIPVAFDGGAREGVVGWRTFDLRLNEQGPDAGEGDYLRGFGVELTPTEVGPALFEGTVTATLSTTSVSEWTDPYATFTGELVRIGARDVVAEHVLVSGSHPTGRAVAEPPAE